MTSILLNLGSISKGIPEPLLGLGVGGGWKLLLRSLETAADKVAWQLLMAEFQTSCLKPGFCLFVCFPSN